MEESGDDTAQDSNAEEENPIPKIITDDFFENLCAGIGETVKDIEAKQLYSVAEEVQRLLAVSQNLRQSLIEETDKNEKMHEEVASAAGKVAQVLKISQNDQDTIAKLRQEIEEAWKQKDAAHTREQIAQEAMFVIREKMDKLEKEKEKYTDKADPTDEVGMSLAKNKEGNVRERDRLAAEVEELNRRLHMQRTYADEVEKKRIEAESKNKELYRILDETSNGAFKEKRFLESIQVQLSEMTSNYQTALEETNRYKSLADQNHHTTVQLNMQLAAVRLNLDKVTSQNNLNNIKLAKLGSDLDNMGQEKEKITNQLNTKTNILKLKEDENSKYRLESAKLIKSREALMKKMMNVDQQKGALEQEVVKLKNLIVTLEKVQDLSNRATEQAKKNAVNLVRERDLARKDLLKTNIAIADHVETISQLKQQIKTMENDVKGHILNLQKQKSLTISVEKERDRNAEEVQTVGDKVDQLNEDLSLSQTQIAQLKEKLVEVQAKLTQVQLLFETARNERSAFQRDLQFCTEDRDSLNERMRITERKAVLLIEENSVKEADLMKAQKQIERLEKEKQMFKTEVQQTIVALQHTKTELQEVRMENTRVYKTVSDYEVRLGKYHKDLESTLKEKDLVGTQLVRRNDEIVLLNEKLSILQIALDRGEGQYAKRLDDIKLLKIEISNLRSQRNLLSRGLANTADMRQEVLQLNRVLTQERVKSKVLEEEMATPMNVHRWRKLSGKDPDKMEMIVKINALQKRILSKTVLSAELECKLKESQKTFLSLKDATKKLPDPTVKQRLNSTQRALTGRTRKLKALIAELNIMENEAKSKDCLLDEFKKDLTETKKQLLKEKQEKINFFEKENTEQIMPPGNNHRTLGAGFKIPA